ncbi:OmpA family protein [candidate division GN15 bacterium]|nr:OmpA family protein [candidate division GN15 bacterium]
MLNRRPRKDDDGDNLDRWLLTYADLITLLLAFFVVMYSMSQIDAKKFGKMAQALSGVLKGGDVVLDRWDLNPAASGHGLLKVGDLQMLQKYVEEKSEEMGRQEEVITEITERGLVVRIMESVIFEPGATELGSRAQEILDLVAQRIKDLPNHIRIEGHCDDREPKSDRYPSHWELSAARATRVVRYLIEQHGVSPDRISALGYGEHRPVRPNNSIDNRAQNRRVDIVVLTEELSSGEPRSEVFELSPVR